MFNVKTIASNIPLRLGDEFDYVGVPHLIVGKIPFETWWEDLLRRRERDKLARSKPTRAGIYYPESKKFKPSKDLPKEEFKYCYLLEEK